MYRRAAVVAVVALCAAPRCRSTSRASGCRPGSSRWPRSSPRSGSRSWSASPASSRSRTRSSSPSAPTATASSPGRTAGADAPAGLGLPPLLALIGAVLLAGLAGALFSPISGRRARHLSRARLPRPGLPRPAHPPERDRDHRRLPRLARAALQPVRLQFSTASPDELVILGVPFGTLEQLWYLGLVLVAVSLLVRPQPRRAAGRAARWRRSATARSRPRPTASTSSATRRPRSRCRRCTPGSAAC